MKKIFALLALVMVAMTASAVSGYTLTTKAEHGTIAFKVNGTAIAEGEAPIAPAGATVTVTVEPHTGWQTKGVTAKQFTDWGNAKSRGIGIETDVTLTGSGNEYTFTMPAYNVEVSATFKQLANAAWIQLQTSTFTYDGTAKEPGVTVKVGDDVTISATAYTVSYSNNVNAAAGSAEAAPRVTVTINNSEDYAGEAFTTFTIQPATLTALTLKATELLNTYGEQTVEAASVKAGELTVPADGYTLSGNKATAVGTYTATATGKGNYQGTVTADYAIVEPQPTVGVEASDATNEEKEIANVTMNMEVADNAADNVKTEQRTNEETGETETVTVIPIVLESINIPATAAVEEITVTVPAEIREGNVVYEVTEITADAFKTPAGSDKEVVKVVLPETDEVLTIADGAMKPENKLLEIETPLSLLDDYALMNSLKENFEAVKISAKVKPANRYWTFSSGVDCVLPEGVTAYKVVWDAGTPRIVPLEESDLTLKDGRRGIKANNGVLIASQKGNAYEIVASPGNQTSEDKEKVLDPEYDANSYEGNCLMPTIASWNYQAGDILILKNNEFHTIRSNASKVKPCKAVFSLKKAGVR